jgi:cytochrome o ubiquinol oxidase subunit III
MSAFEAATGRAIPNRVERERGARGLDHAAAELAFKRIVVGYGFWIFLLSDIVMFSAFFATYAVLVGATAGGPSGRELFNLGNVALETACLLLSSFTCGLASIGARTRNGMWFYGAMAVTFLLGVAFLAIEVHEFMNMIARGGRPDAQRIPVGLLHTGRLPRPACDHRSAVAADDDGAGVRQRVPGRYPPARPMLQPVLACP